MVPRFYPMAKLVVKTMCFTHCSEIVVPSQPQPSKERLIYNKLQISAKSKKVALKESKKSLKSKKTPHLLGHEAFSDYLCHLNKPH